MDARGMLTKRHREIADKPLHDRFSELHLLASNAAAKPLRLEGVQKARLIELQELLALAGSFRRSNLLVNRHQYARFGGLIMRTSEMSEREKEEVNRM